MKRIIIFAVVLFVAVNINLSAKGNHYGVGGYFYSHLAPYGSWIEIDYGVVVWRPTIIRTNWLPYQMGRWVWTYDGWYWDSYEPFGYITYHYGRWYYDDYYGWLWYPDYEWAPAWVEWRYDNDYIGWAPLHPYAVFSISVGIYFTSVYYTPYHHWHFVDYRNFCDPYVYNYYVGTGYKYRIHSGTKYRHNYVYRNGRVQNRGIDIDYVSVRSGQKIKQRDLIRVSDSRELNRDELGRNQEIRTLDIKKEELVRNDLGRMDIKRENRKTSLELDKIQIGKRESVTTNRNNVKSRELNKRNDSDVKNRNDVQKDTDKRFDKNRIETQRNKESGKITNERVDVRKKETNNQIDVRKRNEGSLDKNEKMIKEQNRTKNDNRFEQNNQKQNKQTEVKRENTRVTTNNKETRHEVKEQKKDNNQQQNKETRVNTSRNNENSNNRERSQR